MGNWDEARMTNAPGQSGDPRSPFFDNLLQGWAEEKSFPLLYTREEIEKNAAFTISLRPAGQAEWIRYMPAGASNQGGTP